MRGDRSGREVRGLSDRLLDGSKTVESREEMKMVKRIFYHCSEKKKGKK